MTREEKSRGDIFVSIAHSVMHGMCLPAIAVVVNLHRGCRHPAYQKFTVHNNSKITVRK